MSMYNDAFYDQITEGAVRSARKIIPQVINIFGKPASVIDFGCGTGAWLSVFAEHDAYGWGLDGDYVDRERLLIPADWFHPTDLSQPYTVVDKFDLAMSLEVAEHLPESIADTFAKSLCDASDNILFSAAVPGQNGVNHINEQWPSYWVPKFQALGYSCSSNFRFDFWHDDEIENWYRQNILLFKKENKYTSKPWGMDHSVWVHYFNSPQVLDVIHYNNWNGKIGR